MKDVLFLEDLFYWLIIDAKAIHPAALQKEKPPTSRNFAE